jgi:uncharacterized protein YlxW (UPF0749 family)
VNPFVSRINHNSWVVPVSLMALVLGFMIALAWVTDQNRPSRRALLSPVQQGRVSAGPIDVQEGYLQLQQEVAKLRDEKTRLENVLGDQQDSTKLLNDSLQETKFFGALTEVEGPGLVVTLRDSQKPSTSVMAYDQTIHDVDLMKIVNELWNAGAEAISVNNHRVGLRTSVRCVGSVIQVDNVQVSSPIKIRAIGDGETMMGALNMLNGVLAELRSMDESMVDLELVKKMRLPAYAGATANRHATVPKEKEEPK